MSDRAVVTFLALAAGLAVTMPAAAAEETEPAAAPSVQVRVADGALTVNARDAPLADVLRAIGEQAHVDVQVSRRVATRVTRSFVSPTLEDAIRRLVRGHSAVWIYAPSPTGVPRLTELRVVAAPTAGNAAASLSPADRAGRLQEIRALARRQDAAASSELARYAHDGDLLVRQSALAALTRRRGPDAVAALERALGDTLAAIRTQALHGLRQVSGDGAVPRLVEALGRDPDPGVRRTAARLLASSGRSEAREALEAAASDADPSVRRSAAAGLAAWRRRAR